MMNKISEHKKEIEKLQTAKGKLRDNVYKQEITINKMEKKLGKVSESSFKKPVFVSTFWHFDFLKDFYSGIKCQGLEDEGNDYHDCRRS